MLATLTYQLDAPNIQKATATRDRLASLLDADDDLTLIAADLAQNQETFTVTGVDTASKSPFKEQVEAKDEEDAKRQAVGSSKTRIVAEVRRS